MATTKQKTKGVKFTTPVGRASYPYIFEPKAKYKQPDKFEYTIEVLFDKGTDLKTFEAAVESALVEAMGPKNKWPSNATIVRPLTNQEVLIEKAGDKPTDHYTAGAMYARFKTNADNGRPIIVDQNMNDVIEPSTIYGGCFVRVSGTIKVHQIEGKDPATKKPTLTVYATPYLSGVQFVKDGDSFGGGKRNAADMFEAVAFDNDLVG